MIKYEERRVDRFALKSVVFCRTVDGRQGWQSACCAVLTQVQQTINTKYHTKLAVNSLKFAQCSVFSPENKMECTSCK